MELVEGKDAPKDGPALEFNSYAKTAALLLRLCESMFSTSKSVILDRFFCVFKATRALLENGVHASALTKKRWC